MNYSSILRSYSNDFLLKTLIFDIKIINKKKKMNIILVTCYVYKLRKPVKKRNKGE